MNFSFDYQVWKIHFPTRKDTEVENQSIFTAPKGDDRQKKIISTHR